MSAIPRIKAYRREIEVANDDRIPHDRAMRRLLVILALGFTLSGCAIDPYRQHRPARLLLGASSRHLASTPTTVAAREAMPSSTTTASTAYTASGQFTMLYRALRAGVELETGRMDVRGSNFAGAYGVLGAEHGMGAASIGVELAGGWRGIRVASGEDNENTLIWEPRVRGSYRVGEQVSLGGVAGATLGERGAWMIGLNIGFHDFGALGR